MGLPGDSGVGKTGCAPFGAALTASHSSITDVNLAGDALTALPELEFDSDTLPRQTRGGLPASVPMSALATLTLAALTIALIEKLQAAPSDATLIDDTIAYKDLEHGTLLIAPKGGTTKGIVLDDPELTVIVGPPDGGFVVQQLVNSSADMALLLAAADAVHFIYQLGQADPFTTGSTQRAETHLFFPDQPNIQLASNPLPLLPPLGDSPNTNNGTPDPTGSNAPPPQPFLLTFSIGDDRVLSHDETPGVQSSDTTVPIPNVDLADLGNPASIGRAQIGDETNPFITTTGVIPANFSVLVTVEASSQGEPSGLSVTGGGPIFLYTEETDGGQVVVGRESANGEPNNQGAIAFIVYVTPDGEQLWIQESLPIDHGNDNNDFDSVQSVIDAALRVRVSVSDGTDTVSQMMEIGERIAFVDDGPIAQNDTAEVHAQSTPATVNALVILDKSGSMGSDDNEDSRISLAKAAILDFASQPNVLSIRILPFDGAAGAPSDWFDLTTEEGFAELAAFLNPITGSGNTNYQDAIHDAQETWEVAPASADLDNVYFISDGSPTVRSGGDGNADSGGSNSGLTAAEKVAWESFLDTNDIDNAYAVAINSGLNNVDLQEIAYPNTPDETNNVIVLASATGLSATLQATTLTGTTEGNVLFGDPEPTGDDDSFGSDGEGLIKTLSFDSDGDGDVDANDDVYSFDGEDVYLNDFLDAADPNQVTFDTFMGGTFTFDFETGDWGYTAPENFDAEFVERFTYTIVDGDGDETAPASLNITVMPPSDQVALYLESAQHTTAV